MSTESEWLHDLIYAMNYGDIDKFNVIVSSNQDKYFSQPVLVNQHEVIKQKLVLLSLVNIAFERSSLNRIISFQDIATRARIPLNQVLILIV